MKKVLLCVLDGVGLSKIKDGNALINANKPNIDYLMKEYPNKGINASGTFVGLPDGQMGNSEVGHLTIGAGRIIYQSLELINRAIKDESFYSNESFLNAIRHAKENNSKLHIMGLLSDGGVHSHINHIKALLKLCKKEDFSNVYFHIFTDGRDTFKESSISYIDDLNNEINELGIGKICTISGRYYAMDRDKRWDRLKKCYDVIVNNTGNKCDDYKKYITDSYEKGITDEFIEPVIIDESGKIEENDSIIWANFRPDRAIQILRSLVDPNFDGFDRKIFNNLYLTTMMYVSDDVKSDIAFKKEIIDNTLGIYLSKLGKKQLRIAETEKYAHVTYFFDGGRDLDLNLCDRVLIPSPKVATYDLKPEMSAREITSNLLENIFVVNTPLHDGATIIGKDKILAAGCVLPLTNNKEINKKLGTRHRAGIGLSEISDALVIIVSEETGIISLAINGRLTRNYDKDRLRSILLKIMDHREEKNVKTAGKKVKTWIVGKINKKS